MDANSCPWSPTCVSEAPVRPAPRADGPNPREVREFFEQYKAYTEMDEDAYQARVADVVAEIQATGTYTHTTDELTVGAKLAWYNHTRCIGKLYWRWLTVRDCRDVTTPEGIRDECFEHQRVVHNGGRIKPTITIFAARRPGKPAAAPAQRPDRRLRRLPQRGRHRGSATAARSSSPSSR